MKPFDLKNRIPWRKAAEEPVPEIPEGFQPCGNAVYLRLQGDQAVFLLQGRWQFSLPSRLHYASDAPFRYLSGAQGSDDTFPLVLTEADPPDGHPFAAAVELYDFPQGEYAPIADCKYDRRFLEENDQGFRVVFADQADFYVDLIAQNTWPFGIDTRIRIRGTDFAGANIKMMVPPQADTARIHRIFRQIAGSVCPVGSLPICEEGSIPQLTESAFPVMPEEIPDPEQTLLDSLQESLMQLALDTPSPEEEMAAIRMPRAFPPVSLKKPVLAPEPAAEPAPQPEEPAELPLRELPEELPTREEPAELPPREEPAELPLREEPAELPLREEPAELPLREESAELPLREEPAPVMPAAEVPVEAPAGAVSAAEEAKRFYRITFDLQGGTYNPGTQIKRIGKPLELPPYIPVKENCAFLGWAEIPNNPAVTYAPGDLFTKDQDATLYALWQSAPQKSSGFFRKLRKST